MMLSKKDLSIIRNVGCYYVGLGCSCYRCPFKNVRKGNEFLNCMNLTDNPHLLLKTASEVYRTDKKFAKIFDERCGQYKSALSLKAVVL